MLQVPETARKALTATRRRALLRPVLMIGGVLVVIVAALLFWLFGGRYVSSDDTYVDGRKVSLSTDVSGLVDRVDVTESQHVTQGQELFQLDTRVYDIALANAKAKLAQAVLDVKAAKQGYAQALAQIQAQKIALESDKATLARYASVVGSGGVTKQTYQNQQFQVQADQAKVDDFSAQAGMQLARLAGDPNIDPTAVPAYQSAAADVAEAERQLDHATVRAPFSGTVTGVDNIAPGMYLTAGTAAFGEISDSDIWITSQPKESQLTWVRPGNPVTITVDTYPGQTWKGTVESISPASGSEFSILPAQNSSGNWVKVVQRIPLRVHIASGPKDLPLRDGMSAEISIDTGHKRHLSDLF